jgi:hypothetical protein
MKTQRALLSITAAQVAATLVAATPGADAPGWRGDLEMPLHVRFCRWSSQHLCVGVDERQVLSLLGGEDGGWRTSCHEANEITWDPVPPRWISAAGVQVARPTSVSPIINRLPTAVAAF